MKLPQPVINSLVSSMSPPTGIWKDFQHDYDFYQFLKTLVSLNKISTSDLPDEPNPEDYPDTISAGTRG
jgi:hypothetical protein